jgi:hypothetical protein
MLRQEPSSNSYVQEELCVQVHPKIIFIKYEKNKWNVIVKKKYIFVPFFTINGTI